MCRCCGLGDSEKDYCTVDPKSSPSSASRFKKIWIVQVNRSAKIELNFRLIDAGLLLSELFPPLRSHNVKYVTKFVFQFSWTEARSEFFFLLQTVAPG